MSEDRKRRILIADDREENRYVLRRILTQAGFECQEAACGSDALEIAQTLPDLIILDVRLPDMSGYEVCQKIKSDPRTAAVPVLQISAAFVAAADRARALEVGADGYLTHPIDGVVLVATVRALLRLRAAEALALRSADRWQATFDALAEGLAVTDAEGRVLRCNEAFQKICGNVAAVGAGRGLFLQRLLGTTQRVQQTVNREIEHDGRTLQVSVSPVKADSAEGEWIIVLSDISDRKLAEYAIRTAEKLAATGKLASAISHEINNPLEALINMIYLAASSDSVETIHEHLAHANHELERISRVTKQTLSFHRDTQKPVEIDLGMLVGEVVGLFERSASARGVKLVFDRRSTPHICGFPGQLSQVFGNLIRNAAEAGPRGSDVSIRVRGIHREGREGARVTIHDRGCGIPENIRGKIFDPFFTTKALKGSGLGLWVSRTMVLKHGGTIRFRSSARAATGGTTFEVFLPVDGMATQPLVELDAEDAVA
jgi:two-component system NtrC family sensor kinase